MAKLARMLVGTAACACLGAIATACLTPPQKSPASATVAAAVPPPAPVAGVAKKISVPGLPASIAWSSTGPILVPKSDAKHDLVAIKDPTIVRYKDRWHVYASSVAKGGVYGMVYISFADWADTANATFYTMDRTPGFNTYVAAPQLFYFTPKKKWFLVFQSGPPMYSTSDDPSDPTTWTPPMPFYTRTPPVVEDNGGWLDFWVICDAQFCHLFFSNDHGRWYKSKTAKDKFPRGFGEPVVVLEDAEAGRVFEASNVYKIAGSDKYLALIEAFDRSSGSRRYFRSWTADTLEGPWAALHEDGTAPFAGMANVSFADGKAWCNDISHGEMIRAGYDETLTLDGGKLQYLYQAFDPSQGSPDYNSIPWRLGLLTLK